jgi:microtubule-associated protein, RP/EB family
MQKNIVCSPGCDISAALCQVFDSIFLDIPMSRVKFNVNTEYAYITNFKVLQSELSHLSSKHNTSLPSDY